ncbi:hypothetical protein KJY73_06395 [Bowmanella sp. Y26]|uniref:hypothetical protein n=1 Tax=Bowmanella yangjiangensis TaxID=2811230 RepID=UPI001BDBD81C|nr:hypothetical protein [Bowmanella yangjiangensis]MBT1063195.1 hypothetical protein [Bowmanella yangjiangensis]
MSQAAESASSSRKPIRLPLWLPVLIIVVGMLGYVYYDYIQGQAQALNRNYFRELANVALRFDQKLEQLDILASWDNKEFESANQSKINKIKSLFPSAILQDCAISDIEDKTDNTPTRSVALSDTLKLRRNQVELRAIKEIESKQREGEAKKGCLLIDFSDLISLDKQEFNELLLIDKNNAVVASTHSSQALSIVNVDEFSKQIAVELNRDWLQLISNEGKASQHSLPNEVPLPGFSHFLDIKINPGAYRLYFYPFLINDQILTLVGVLPAEKLSSKDSKRWTWGQWLIGVISLVFVWALLRLYLLSVHQTVDEFFYRLTMYSSYLLFAALVSLTLAYAQMQLEKSDKAERAFALLQKNKQQLDSELKSIFTELRDVTEFYKYVIEQDMLGAKLTEDELRKAVKAHLYKSGQPPVLITRLCDSEGNKDSLPIWTVFAPGIKKDEKESGTESCAKQGGCLCSYPRLVVTDTKLEAKILQVSLVGADGKQIGPRVSSYERHGSAKFSDLSKRDYFKVVRQGKGWQTDEIADQQFYIQRLRNIEDGTLGTTLGLSLTVGGRFYEIVADILLPSVELFSLADPLARQDTVLMLVDRRSGDMLFHDEPRHVLTERLDASDQDTDVLRFSLRAERDSREQAPQSATIRALEANYHGFPGWFVHIATPIAPWALVAFVPSDALDNFLTNLFWVNFLILVGGCLLVYLTIAALRRLMDTGWLKTKLNIPLLIDRRKLVLFTSVFIASVLTGYWCATALILHDSSFILITWFGPLLFSLVSMLWGSWHYWRLVDESKHSQRLAGCIVAWKGFIGLTVLVIFTSFMLTAYLNHIGKASERALSWYYAELLKSRQHAQAELSVNMRNQFYSATQLSQVGTTDALISDKQPSAKRPKDILSFGYFTQLTQVDEWLSRYILGVSGAKDEDKDNQVVRRLAVPWWNVLLVSLGLLLLCSAWIFFNRGVLYVRLFGSLNMLRHLNRLHQQVRQSKYHSPDSALCILLRSVYQRGEDLDTQFQLYRQEKQVGSLIHNLIDLCPQLSGQSCGSFCGVRIEVKCSQTMFSVSLFNLEYALEDKSARDNLLLLLNQLKSLRQQKKLSKLNLYCDYHCLRKVNATENLPGGRQGERMTNNEYMAWADCLKDFSVRTQDSSTAHLDAELVAKEVLAMPMLQFVYKELFEAKPDLAKVRHDLRWITLADEGKTAAEWNSLHRIILKAEALFRFWWSACSPSEKLALYYLANGRRVNPSNIVVLEQLAANGLVIVRHGRIRIANQSFAYFVRHAETVDNLKNMIFQGNIGNWHSYRVPITLLAVTLLVALGVFSGNSLYMVISSLMGLLGLVGNLLGSVNFIRSNVGS